MALNQLSEKLDQIGSHELGVEFDEMATWAKLEQRLDGRKTFVYRWFTAACILIGLMFLPISLLREGTVQSDAIADQVEVPVVVDPVQPSLNEVAASPRPEKELARIIKKGPGQIQLAEVSTVQLALEPIPVPKRIEQRTAFADEDISMIQASLERSSIEKGKRITVRAQLQSFPDQAKSNQKVLKIKLYEKH